MTREARRIGILGLGAIGRPVARALAMGLQGLALSGVTSRDSGRAREFLADLPGPPPFLEFRELVERSDVIVEAATRAALVDLAPTVLDAGRDLVILSAGTPTRTFCYISDAITGYLLCLLHGEFDAFNIGVERPEIMVREFAEIFRAAGTEITGYGGTVKYEESADPEYMTDNPNRRCPVITKARTALGYDPGVLVNEGVRRYLKFLAHEARS